MFKMVTLLKHNIKNLTEFRLKNMQSTIIYKNSIFYYSSSSKTRVKTINPADVICVQRQAVKKLVPRRQCLEEHTSKEKRTAFQELQITPIYVCKPQDMKRVCKPPPHSRRRSETKPPLTRTQKIMQAVWFGFKLGILGGVVYFTWVNGLWGDTEETNCLYSKIYNHTFRFLRLKPPQDDPDVPKTSEISYHMKKAWNRGVCQFFDIVCFGPGKVLVKIREHTGTVSKADKIKEENSHGNSGRKDMEWWTSK